MQNTRCLRRPQNAMALRDEVEEVIWKGQAPPLTELESDASLRIQPKPAGGRSNRRLVGVDSPDPGPGELPGKEENAFALAAADLENPLGISLDMEDCGRQRGEGGGVHAAIIAPGRRPSIL